MIPTGVGEMGQIIGETGVGKMGVNHKYFSSQTFRSNLF